MADTPKPSLIQERLLKSVEYLVSIVNKSPLICMIIWLSFRDVKRDEKEREERKTHAEERTQWLTVILEDKKIERDEKAHEYRKLERELELKYKSAKDTAN